MLAALQQEPGGRRVIELAGGAAMSAVNWSEVFAKLVERKLDNPAIERAIGLLPVRIEPFTQEDARRAGRLYRFTRAAGLSFGDRACLALAQRLSARVLTADKAWSRVDLGIAIEQIR